MNNITAVLGYHNGWALVRTKHGDRFLTRWVDMSTYVVKW